MTAITNEYMMAMLTKTRAYTIVILKSGPNFQSPEKQQTVWEHARRNFELRAAGHLAIVCPVMDGSDVSGVGIFNGTPEQVKEIMDGDPGVQAGIFTYEIHPCKSFPGDSLPA